jgi:hypothetical protein
MGRNLPRADGETVLAIDYDARGRAMGSMAVWIDEIGRQMVLDAFSVPESMLGARRESPTASELEATEHRNWARRTRLPGDPPDVPAPSGLQRATALGLLPAEATPSPPALTVEMLRECHEWLSRPPRISRAVIVGIPAIDEDAIAAATVEEMDRLVDLVYGSLFAERERRRRDMSGDAFRHEDEIAAATVECVDRPAVAMYDADETPIAELPRAERWAEFQKRSAATLEAATRDHR